MDPLLFALGAASTVLLMNPRTKTGSTPGPTPLSSLPDCRPENQGGKWKRDYDLEFFEMSQSYGVPFCLLKAHAIRESALDHRAFRQEPKGKASYGLMQVLWWKNSQRFQQWGVSDDIIGDGSYLYDPYVNIQLACEIILDNFKTWGNLRDAINAYNTGRDEKTRPAPGNYVDHVIKYYETLLGRSL